MTDPHAKGLSTKYKASTERKGAPSKKKSSHKNYGFATHIPESTTHFRGLIEVLFPLKSRRLSLERLVAVALQNLHRLTSSNIPALRPPKAQKEDLEHGGPGFMMPRVLGYSCQFSGE